MNRSIRFVLTLWYIGIFAVILSGFGAALYTMMSASLTRHLDKLLVLQADGVAEQIFAFWRAERARTLSGPGNWQAAPTETLRGEIEQGRLPELVTRWAHKTGQLDTSPPCRVVARDGRPLGTSASFTPENLPLAPAAISQALQGHTVYETVTHTDHRVRIMTHPIVDSGHTLYLVQTGVSLEQTDESLRRLRDHIQRERRAVVLCSRRLGRFGSAELIRFAIEHDTDQEVLHVLQRCLAHEVAALFRTSGRRRPSSPSGCAATCLTRKPTFFRSSGRSSVLLGCSSSGTPRRTGAC